MKSQRRFDPANNPRVMTADGLIEGTTNRRTGIHSFKGIPFAAPPVGDLRWKPPQPAESWTGVRSAHRFGPRAMQLPIFSDMVFRSNGVSEDCLYLNVWTPAASAAGVSAAEKLPVLVYFYGGGLIGGDGSEPRYDGESLAGKGIVTLTVNYRLGLFGFFAHPELAQESPHHSAGNYGFLDQTAALRWVRDNISAFGGDPGRVTIAGESAGSISVSAQMVSPLARGLFAGAIGSSASLMGTLGPVSQAEAEQMGAAFAARLGAGSLAELRAMPAESLIKATAGLSPEDFPSTVDGYFIPKLPVDIFSAGEQARVPLLVGWNTQEGSCQFVMGKYKPAPKRYRHALLARFKERAEEALRLYPGSSKVEAGQSATELAGDCFTGYSTWKWADLHSKTSGQPVYRYLYARPRPAPIPAALSEEELKRLPPEPPRGAVHSAEIEYAMGNLATNQKYAWMPEDYRVSEMMQSFYANFVKTGNPNGAGLPEWPALEQGAGPVMLLDVDTRLIPEPHRERYLFLDEINQGRSTRLFRREEHSTRKNKQAIR